MEREKKKERAPPDRPRKEKRKKMQQQKTKLRRNHLGGGRPSSSPVRRRPPPPINTTTTTTTRGRRLSLPAVVGSLAPHHHHHHHHQPAFVAAGFARGAVKDHRPRTPYLAGSEEDGGVGASCKNHDSRLLKLPEVAIKAASNRLAEDAARREERRKALSDKIWQSRDADTRWNKRGVDKDEVEGYVDRLHRGGMAWKENKREKAARLRAELDEPKVRIGCKKKKKKMMKKKKRGWCFAVVCFHVFVHAVV